MDRLLRPSRVLARSRVRVLLYLCLALAAPLGHALDARPMLFRHVGSEDGLSQNAVLDMLQDRRGFMWLATENGVNRYNGYSIERFLRGADPTSLHDDFVYSMAEDDDGDLWFATARSGVARWSVRDETFSSYRHVPGDPQSLGDDHTRKLIVTRDGMLWVATKGGGVSVLDPATGRFRNYSHDPDDANSVNDDHVYALFEDRSGNVWVGTDRGTSRYDPRRDRFYHYRPPSGPGAEGDPVRALFEDHAGTIWIGTFGGGLRALDPTTGRFSGYRHEDGNADSLCHDNVHTVFEDDARRLWVGTERGLCLLDRESDHFHAYEQEPGDNALNDNDILSLYQDRSGLLWVGTRNAGVNIWNPRSWLLGHHVGEGTTRAPVSSFATDSSYYWVGTTGRGLQRVDRTTGEKTSLGTHNGLSDDRVMALEFDGRGHLWIGTMRGGLNRLALDSGSITQFRHDPDDTASLPSDGVMSLHEDQSGRLWVGTYGGGFAAFDEASGRFERYGTGAAEAASQAANQGMALTEDLDGVIWIGTENGLNRLEPETGKLTHFLHDPNDPMSLSGNAVYALHVAPSGELWVGTAGGGLDLAVEDPDTPGSYQFVSQALVRGYGVNVVYGIQSDADGNLWLSSNSGLLMYAADQQSVKPYRKAHGLQGNEFNFGAHHAGVDGYLYFGGTNGFNRFRPEHLAVHQQPPTIVLKRLEESNEPADTSQPYWLLDAIDVGYQHDVLTFEFAALDYTDPRANRFQYLLRGFDDDWIDAGMNHRVTYTNLDPGDYSFRVRGASSEGAWSDQDLALAVRIEPPPWMSDWAYFAYLTAALALVSMMWRMSNARRRRENHYRERLEVEVANRTVELRDRNEELRTATEARSQFLARMSHEIRTPMSGVLGMSEILLSTELDNKQGHLAKTIHRSAKSLLGVINDILDFSKIEASRVHIEQTAFDLIDEIDQCVVAQAAQAAGRGLELIVDSPAAHLGVRGDQVRVRQIVTNLVGNAIKFTERGEVVVTVAIDSVEPARSAGDAVHQPGDDAPATLAVAISVEDSGIGIHADNMELIFDLFAQEDGSTTRRFGGTGLGLAISRQLAELMGGSLDVESQQGVGSTFTLTLTLEQDDLAPESASAPELGDRRALIVSRNARLRETVARRFRELGDVRVNECERLADLPEDAALLPDLIILDSTEHGEAEALLRIRSSAEHVRVIQLAPVSDLRASEPGIDRQIAKPLTTAVLWAELAQLLAPAPAPARGQVVAARQPISVLLVEDTPVNQEVILGMLDVLGVSADVADNGFSAIYRLEAQRYDIVFMDCNLPGLDGLEVTRRIRKASDDGPVIVALTANNLAGEREKCLDAGMDDFLSKPCSVDDLEDKLTTWTAFEHIEPVLVADDERAPYPVDVAGPDIAGLIDTKALQAIRGLSMPGKEDMLGHVIDLYRKDAQTLLSTILDAAHDDDRESMRQAAHRLKSASANLGANEFADVCRRLEEQSCQDGGGYSRELILQIESQISGVLAELDRHAQRL